MADFTALKAEIQNYVKQNGNNAITGDGLQAILISMVQALGDSAINDLASSLSNEVLARQGADTTLQGNIDAANTAITTLATFIGNGYMFRGIATLETVPSALGGKVFYITATAGQYTNMGGITVSEGVSILAYDGTSWSASLVIGIDATPTNGSNGLVRSGGVYTSLTQENARAIAAETTSAEFNSTTKKLIFKNSAGTVLYEMDATPFIVDGMLNDVKIVGGNLVFSFNTDAGKQDISIPLTDIFNPSNYYNKTAIDALLLPITTRLAAGYIYMGLATPSGTPDTSVGKVFYLTATAGTYTNYGNLTVNAGITILSYNGSVWSADLLVAIDSTPTQNSNGLVTSGGVFAAIKTVADKLAEGYLYKGIATAATDPSTPSTKVFYIATAAGTYTNFANTQVSEGITILKYDGTNWTKEQVLFLDGGVFDISAYNLSGDPLAPTKYADLEAAIGTNGVNIPAAIRKGGMTVKFIQSSDNKYVQCRFLLSTFTTEQFVDVTNWQGIDGDGLGKYFSDGLNIYSVYERMNIADATPSPSNAFKSDKSYYKLNDGFIQINSSYSCTIAVYNNNKEYLGFKNSSPTGIRISNIRGTYPSAVYIRVSLRKSDYSAISDEEYANMSYEILRGANPERYTKEALDEKLTEEYTTKTDYSKEQNARLYSDILLSEKKQNLLNKEVYNTFQNNKILLKGGSITDFSGYKVYTIENSSNSPLYIKTVLPDIAFNVYANCILYYDSSIIANIPLIGSQVLSLPKGCTIKLCVTSDVDVYTSNTPTDYHFANNTFYGKKILYLGTSIPAGSSEQVTINGYTGANKYPEMIGNLLGCTVYNEAVGSSIVRATNPRSGTYKGMPYDVCLKSLSQTISEKQSILDHWSSGLDADGNIASGGTYGWKDLLVGQGSGVPADYHTFADDTTILSWSYENKIIAKYFNQYSGKFIAKPDIVVFDHGYNDIGPNWYISGGMTYYDATEAQATEFTNNYTDRSKFPSAISYIIERIYDFEPRQKIILVGHYSNDLPEQANRKYSEVVCTAQDNCAKYWNLPIVKTWEKTQWNEKEVATTGYWENGVWKTGSTQQLMMIYKVWLADELHPHSDKSGKANMRLAEIIANGLKTL